VLLALIETGMSRQDAYRVVQRNAMRAWESQTQFADLLRCDPDVSQRLSGDALDALFDYTYYTRNIGATFERLGL
jgi:adenylosuccinate lyase